MRKIIILTLLSVCLFAESSFDIAKRSYEMTSGYKGSISKTTMILKNAEGTESIRKLEIKKLETSSGDKSLIRFLHPLDIKDTKLLSFEQIGKDDKQWLYLPALKRVKRISSSNKSGSFMASEFSYEDIASNNYENYTYEGEAKKVIKNRDECFEIIRVPKDKNSGYSKQVVYVETRTYLAKYGDYYDKRGRLLKEISFLEYQNIEGIYRVKKIDIKNVQSGKSSLLIWEEDMVNVGLDKSEISQRALK